MSEYNIRNKRQRQRWNKKFREKRQQGQQWRIKENKTWKFKLQRRRKTKRKMLQNYTRDESNYYIYDHVSYDSEEEHGSDYYRYISYWDILPVINETVGMRFTECYAYWCRYLNYERYGYRNRLAYEHKLTYDKYLHYMPYHLQFSYNMYKFRPIFTKDLTKLFNDKYIEIKPNEHEFWQDIVIALFDSNGYAHPFNCAHCKSCKQQLSVENNLSVLLLYFAILDLESLILDIVEEIQYDQNKKINIVNEYNVNNNKQSCCEYLMDVSDTYGISYDIWHIILDFVSNEYPIVINDHMQQFEVCNRNYFRSSGRFSWNLHISLQMQWIHHKSVEVNTSFQNMFLLAKMRKRIMATHISKNDFPNLGKPKKVNIFHESAKCCIGSTNYNNKNIYFYYCEIDDRQINQTYRKIMFAECWLDLWNIIENKSIKIDCYSFLFEILSE